MQKTARILAMAAATAMIATAPATAQDAEPQSDVEVTRAVVATGVADREPVGEATSFAATAGTLYFYTVLEGDFPEQRIEHVWLHEGEEVARVGLNARGPRWRTWSTKTLPADPAGDWTVRVLDASGTELESVDFTIGS